MNRYAIIENGKVVNTAVSDEPLASNWVKSDVAGIGWDYDGVKFTPAEMPIEMKITKLSFKQRFTAQERIAIRTAAATNPVVYDFQDLVDSATYIDLARADTIDALKQLEQFGLIAEGRSDVILGPPIAEDEKWRG
jgi:hypothetical protein